MPDAVVTRNERVLALMATLDTKGAELAFVQQVLSGLGWPTLIIDTGVLGVAPIKADVPREEVAREGGIELAQAIGVKSKGELIGAMADGAARVVRRLWNEGRLAGVLGLGGGQGTFIGTTAMRALPLGVPKVMVTTLGSSNLRGFVDTKDISVFNSVTDILGLNAVSKPILTNAARALAGMAAGATEVKKSDRYTVGATMLGTTTVGMMLAKQLLEDGGMEVVTFHANGSGGKAMEELADRGMLDAIFDYSTHEVLAHRFGGIFSAGPDRLTTAGRLGLPQLVVPGGIDYLIMGPVSTLTPELLERPHIVHNAEITLVRASAAEMAQVGKEFAVKLNSSKGPVGVAIPTKGYCEPNQEGGPFWNPDADQAFVDALRANAGPSVDIKLVSAHINDPEFADASVAYFKELVSKTVSRRGTTSSS